MVFEQTPQSDPSALAYSIFLSFFSIKNILYKNENETKK